VQTQSEIKTALRLLSICHYVQQALGYNTPDDIIVTSKLVQHMSGVMRPRLTVNMFSDLSHTGVLQFDFDGVRFEGKRLCGDGPCDTVVLADPKCIDKLAKLALPYSRKFIRKMTIRLLDVSAAEVAKRATMNQTMIDRMSETLWSILDKQLPNYTQVCKLVLGRNGGPVLPKLLIYYLDNKGHAIDEIMLHFDETYVWLKPSQGQVDDDFYLGGKWSLSDPNLIEVVVKTIEEYSCVRVPEGATSEVQ
jgi:hypothetical protein